MKKLYLCIFSALNFTSYSVHAQGLSSAESAGACAAYHIAWSLLREQSGSALGRSDSMFSEQLHDQLSYQWKGNPSFTNAYTNSLKILNRALQDYDGKKFSDFAKICMVIGISAGRNTK